MLRGAVENGKVRLDGVLDAVLFQKFLRPLQLFADVYGHQEFALGFLQGFVQDSLHRNNGRSERHFHYIPPVRCRQKQSGYALGNPARGVDARLCTSEPNCGIAIIGIIGFEQRRFAATEVNLGRNPLFPVHY
jgi:hypothetical protein